MQSLDSLMKSLFLGLLLFSVVAMAEPPDSLHQASIDQEKQEAISPSLKAESADSLQPRAPATQTWIVPLVFVVTVGTAFFLLFTVRSR